MKNKKLAEAVLDIAEASKRQQDLHDALRGVSVTRQASVNQLVRAVNKLLPLGKEFKLDGCYYKGRKAMMTGLLLMDSVQAANGTPRRLTLSGQCRVRNAKDTGCSA